MVPLVLVAGFSLHRKKFRFRNVSNHSKQYFFTSFLIYMPNRDFFISLTCVQLLCLSDVKLLLLALLAAVASSDTLMFAAVLAKN